jgi:cell division protein FtsN
MVDRIKQETFLQNYKVIELSKTKYRVLIGPFNDIKSIQESFEEIKSLNFENIEILKHV